jgi:NADH:ubiquinone oxidoreductase subunit 2 (subunit N)
VTLLLLVIVASVAAGAAFVARERDRVATAFGLTGLLATLVLALALTPGQSVELGGSILVTTGFMRLFTILATLTSILLVIVGFAAGSRRDAMAVSLVIIGTGALTLAIVDPRIAVVTATAGGAAASLLTLTATDGRAGTSVGIRVLRGAIVAGVMAIAATAWIGRDLSELAAQPVVFGLAYLAFALAVAIRAGAIPFHAWAARLTDSVPETALPMITAWAPAAFAVVCLAWVDASIAPLLVDLDSVRIVVVVIALTTIVLGAVAAWIQDDIEHVVGYSIIGDAGLVLLAIAALDPEAWAAGRTWILGFVVSRSAFAAWAAATRATYLTGRIADLRGWAIRTPLLGAAFVVVVLASIGVPGLAIFEARVDLVNLNFEGPGAVVVLLATLAPLAYYVRIGVAGVARPEPGPAPGGGRRPVVGPLDVTDLPGWSSRTWSDNRAFTAASATMVLAVLAVVVSAGGLGVTDAAIDAPPTGEPAVESFAPGGG